MSLWSRIANVIRGDRLNREIDEEFHSHIEEAIDEGRDPAEARRSFGPALLQREESRDVKMIVWLDSLRADAVFGWRQLAKRKVTSAAAILSLALAIGACTSAFRLIDALLFRPLPVANPDRLHVVAFEGFGADGRLMTYDSCSYPMFRQMRATLKNDAESIAVSYAERIDLTYATDQQMEKAYRQYVSGWMFPTFGLHPAAGRLLTENDDRTPGAHPYAVLSHDYWTRRFAQDPKIVGRTFRMGNDLFEIAGVADAGFTGTETGTVTDIFLPMAMKNPRTLSSSDNFWLRTLVQLKPGVSPEPVQEKLRATFRAIQEERAKRFAAAPQVRKDTSLNDRLVLDPAAAGRSNLQRDYRRSLAVLAVLVALVLLIACANVANLMMAQAAARAREMALRVSIGAGRWRLVQLVLLESAWLAFLAAALGALFAWWSAPFIVSMINPTDNPARLVLPADWRVLAFNLALASCVTFLFGLAPALRASSVKPVSALKGGEDPHSRRRVMLTLIAVQVAFCFVVTLLAGLFVSTLDRLSHRPTGFSAERVLNLETVTPTAQSPVLWNQVAEHLRGLPGVEAAAIIGWPLMSGESRNGFIAINGAPPTAVLPDFLIVSSSWTDAMRIPLIDGRDFRATETSANVAIVNEAFAKQFFNGESPVGKSFEKMEAEGARVRFQIVGLTHDVRSRGEMRLPIRPTACVPFQTATARGTFVVRTSASNPLALAGSLRQEVARARPGFRVSNLRTQTEVNQTYTVRERLLAMLALFFAAVALLLAGIGLYGVLDYSVLQRRREIGIRRAIGAQAGGIARLVTVDVFSMVLAGALAGLILGMISVQYIESLFYQVKATDPAMLVLPSLIVLISASFAALPAVIHAVRIDPAKMLRAD